MDEKYSIFIDLLVNHYGVDSKRIYTDALRTFAWGTDASFYRLVPKVVVRVKDVREMMAILRTAAGLKLPVTFRAAGTSLSGQSISDSILLVCGKEWEGYKIIDSEAKEIALQPGITGGRVNEILRPYGRAFSPDPASVNSAMVGGIVANNASGMKCGTHANSDRTLRSISIVVSGGGYLDTSSEQSRKTFKGQHGYLFHEIERIRDEIRSNPELVEKIRYKYSIKNVTGLNLLPFIEFDDPFDIIAHCMVGSEGTLGFISEVVMATEEIMPHSASAMVYFTDLEIACRAVVALKKSGSVDACELLDKKSLASVKDTTGKGLTALLLRIDAKTQESLSSRIESAKSVLSQFEVFKPFEFSSDSNVTSEWWKIRSGIFPAVGGTRPPGTTALIEDIAFHIDDLPAATVQLQKILELYGYEDACIYGHALEGNFHFIIAQGFGTQEEIDKYRQLMKAVETLVVDRFNGSLKAEHGTGRNMAPFVRKEWGDVLYNYMVQVKKAFDPDGILNPGVIFNDNPDCFVCDLKPMPSVSPVVDKCIECGFCEINCVSCGLTLSARQRIASQREIVRLENTGEDPGRLAQMRGEFKYFGNETCAGDGLCSTSCPMKINTGELIHELRQWECPPGSTAYKVGEFCAKHLNGVSDAVRLTLDAASFAEICFGPKAVRSLGRGLHKIGMPLWTPSLPKSFSPDALLKKAKKINKEKKIVYFPSCLNRTMGVSEDAPKGERPLPEVFTELCHRAGYEVIFPENLKNLCCGMIWESKGMPDIANAKTAELENALRLASNDGEYTIVCDQSPCLHRMREHISGLRLFEPAEFIHDILLPHLTINKLNRTIALHVTCSSRLMGIGQKIINLAKMCATNVCVPEEIGCCGFAGDKGFTHPELNEWGLRKLKGYIVSSGASEGYSNSRTCEIGLSTNSGIHYRSIVYLVEECTR